MSSMTIFFIFVCVIAVLFLVINLLLAHKNPYTEKISAFECGFHSFLQTRLPFNISFFIYGLLFLLFDLEIILIYPFAVSFHSIDIYGLAVMAISSLIFVLGLLYELGKGALDMSLKSDMEVPFPRKVVIHPLGDLTNKSLAPGILKEKNYPKDILNHETNCTKDRKKKKKKEICEDQNFTSHSNNNKGKNDLTTISPFINIRRLYFIRRAWIAKCSFVIFSILTVLFCVSLYTIVFYYKVGLSVYYSI